MKLPFQCVPLVMLLLASNATIPVLAADPSPAEKPPAGKANGQPAKSPRVAVTISKETTYITGPLRKDGYVDYVAALNQRCSKGVTPENNAAVLFWKAMGPGEIPKPYRQQFFKMLGLPLVPQGDHCFLDLVKYEKDRKGGRKAPDANPTDEGDKAIGENVIQAFQEAGEALDQLNRAYEHPWSKKELPIVAAWLTANEQPLTLLTEATKRPRRYDPVFRIERGWLIQSLMFVVLTNLHVSRAFSTRAMLCAREGNADEAWENVLSCYRLGRLLGQRPFLMDALTVIRINAQACANTQSLLQHLPPSPARAAKMREEVNRLPPLPKMADVIDIGERFLELDTVSRAARGESVTLENLMQGGVPPETIKAMLNVAAHVTIDWDEILRVINTWWDRAVDAYRKPSRPERKAALTKIDDEVCKMAEGAKDLKSLAFLMLANPQHALSQRLGEILVAKSLGSTSRLADCEDRAVMQMELIKLAFALAAYRADHGACPVKLGDLVPKYVAHVPKDIFNDAELHYQLEDGGYVLYSVGVNGKDDGGRSETDQEGSGEDWDDIVVRVRGTATQEKMQ